MIHALGMKRRVYVIREREARLHVHDDWQGRKGTAWWRGVRPHVNDPVRYKKRLLNRIYFLLTTGSHGLVSPFCKAAQHLCTDVVRMMNVSISLVVGAFTSTLLLHTIFA